MKAKLKELFESMEDYKLIGVWNDYQDNTRGGGHIYDMDEFNEIMEGFKPWEIARASYYSGKFCPAHNYFWFNAYGNLESSDFPKYDIYIDDIIDYIIRNNDNLYNDEIQEILEDNEGEC